MSRGIELIGNEDMVRVIIIPIPLAWNDYKRDGYLTILQPEKYTNPF